MTKEEMLALEGVSEETLKNLQDTKGEDDDESAHSQGEIRVNECLLKQLSTKELAKKVAYLPQNKKPLPVRCSING